MPRNEVIEFKVTAEEKESIRSQAAHLKVPVSVFVRSCALREHLKREERTAALAKAKEGVENDPANLNATLDEKGSVVKQETEDLSEGTFDEEDWISRRANQLKARMSSRAARRQAEIEWEEMG